MLLKTIFDFLTQSQISKRYKISTLFRFIKYYYNLQIGLRSGRIYHLLKNQNVEVESLINKISKQDLELIDTILGQSIKKMLTKTKISTDLDFTKKTGYSQLGYNSIYVDKPIAGFWTTGKATYYIPTKPGNTNRIMLEIFSIPPLQVTIGFENEIVRVLSVSALTTKKIEIILDPNKITTEISEIFISTDNFWLPNIITKMAEPIPLGICIRSIHVSYF